MKEIAKRASIIEQAAIIELNNTIIAIDEAPSRGERRLRIKRAKERLLEAHNERRLDAEQLQAFAELIRERERVR